jgi:hypothetical protein
MPLYLLFPGINGNVRRKAQNWMSLTHYYFTKGTPPDPLKHIVFNREVDAVSIQLFRTTLDETRVIEVFMDRVYLPNEEHLPNFSMVLSAVTAVDYFQFVSSDGQRLMESLDCSFEKLKVIDSNSSAAMNPSHGRSGWLGHLAKVIESTKRI